MIYSFILVSYFQFIISLGHLLKFLEQSICVFFFFYFPTHQRQSGGTYQRQASSQRSCLFGLEMRPELVWEDWDLQREFTKILVLKNLHTRLQKLHVRSYKHTHRHFQTMQFKPQGIIFVFFYLFPSQASSV